jgi:hypothetical protein
LEDLEIPEDLVTEYVRGEGRLGGLVAGGLDLDNIDNILRMGLMLGFRPGTSIGTSLIEKVGSDEVGIFWAEEARADIDGWADLRRGVYSVLAFDESNLQYQAMLTELLNNAIMSSVLGEEHWAWTDESLLYKLEAHPSTHEITRRLLAGPPYRPVLIAWFKCPKPDGDDLRLPERNDDLRNTLDKRIGSATCPYVFYDRGTFEKSLNIRISSGEGAIPHTQSIGTASSSTIACVFSKTEGRLSRKTEREAALDTLEEFGLPRAQIAMMPSKSEIYGVPGQAQLSL